MTDADKSLVIKPTGIRKFDPQAESSLIARGLETLQALENKNEEADYYYRKGGLAYYDQGKLDEAIEAYKKVIELRPDGGTH